MDTPTVQKIDFNGFGSIVEESKLVLEIENLANFSNEIVSTWVQLINIDAKWRMTIAPKKREYRGQPNLISIKFEYLKGVQSLHPVNCTFSVDVKLNKRSLVKAGWHDMSLLQNPWRIDNNLLEDIGDFTPPKDFSVHVVFTVKSSPFSNEFINPPDGYREVLATTSKMVADPIFSDFTFDVDGKIFKVHRCILAAASPVFHRLFTSHVKESLGNLCKINNIKPETFDLLLKFIYEGKLPERFSAKELYEAAHYSELERLKEICEKEASNQLTSENAVELYVLALTFNLEQLKKDSWIIVKRDVINLPIEGESLTPEALYDIMKLLGKYKK